MTGTDATVSGEPARTELRHPTTEHLDTATTLAAVHLLLAEDAAAVAAAAAAGDQLAHAIDDASLRFANGGRVHYFGAGASGRLAMLDASEISPTFGILNTTFEVHFPGGDQAMLDSSIDLEDAEEHGFADAGGVAAGDIVVGVSASGSTPYVHGALRHARDTGALTVLISCNPQAPLRELVDRAVIADTGPEALTGSTRLKAGTATKVILNTFSTVLMIRAGRIYSNLMVGMRPTNDKLRRRSVRILAELTATTPTDAARILADSDDDVTVALVRLLTCTDTHIAADALQRTGSVREAVTLLTTKDPT